MDNRIDFESIPWASPARGVREKVTVVGRQRLRLIEFTPDLVEESWCTRGHIGYMLKGELQIAFPNHTIELRKGDGLYIPGGEKSKHKATVLTAVARLVMVEEVEPPELAPG